MTALIIGIALGTAVGWLASEIAMMRSRIKGQWLTDALGDAGRGTFSEPGSTDWELEQDALYRQNNQGWPNG